MTSACRVFVVSFCVAASVAGCGSGLDRSSSCRDWNAASSAERQEFGESMGLQRSGEDLGAFCSLGPELLDPDTSLGRLVDGLCKRSYCDPSGSESSEKSDDSTAQETDGTISGADLEARLDEQLASQSTDPVSDVSCPEQDLRPGETLDCKVTFASGRTQDIAVSASGDSKAPRLTIDLKDEGTPGAGDPAASSSNGQPGSRPESSASPSAEEAPPKTCSDDDFVFERIRFKDVYVQGTDCATAARTFESIVIGQAAGTPPEEIDTGDFDCRTPSKRYLACRNSRARFFGSPAKLEGEAQEP